jgi:fatty-acyl-CoA synthase
MEMATTHQIEDVLSHEHLIDPDDVTNIQFTSGTTGLPKGAALTHMNIVNNGRFIADRLKYTSKDIICNQVPLYHCFGMVIGNLAAANTGATIILPSESYNAVDSLRAVSEERCTSLYGVPTMILDMLNEMEKSPGKYNVQSLRTGVLAGTVCPRALMERVIKELNMKDVTICYGMTETSPVSFQTLTTDSVERKVGTVGCVHPYVECKIIDQNGKIVPLGQPGEICTRGYLVMKGYWGDPKATAKAIDPQGFMRTGDQGVLDKDGYCQIVGRIKDMIARGGEKIYPKEVEDFLLKNPHVNDVQVIGVPDERFGEEVCALIKLKQNSVGKVTKEDIFKFCKDHISHYKIPKYVKFVTEYPLTITGKPQKYLMRDALAEELKNPETAKSYQIRAY